eukprot:SAG11_NODE_2294_length_3556_cov_3.734741_2_plen_138_part_00
MLAVNDRQRQELSLIIPAASKISAGLSISGLPGQIGCGAAHDGCGTVAGCNASYDPDGRSSGSGWTQDSLRDFLNFLDRQGVASIDIWTGDAFELPESVAICHWLIDELRRWRHGPGSTVSTGLVAGHTIRMAERLL